MEQSVSHVSSALEIMKAKGSGSIAAMMHAPNYTAIFNLLYTLH